MTKIRRKPLPTPWNADAAIEHLHRVWSNRGRVRLERITLINDAMVRSLTALWQTSGTHSTDIPHGQLADIGFWRLIEQHDGSGVLEIRGSPW